MKQNQLTLIALITVFISMVALLIMQSAQNNILEIPTTHENLSNNDVDLNSGLLFPDLEASNVIMVNILDPFLDSQVTIVKSDTGIWQVLADNSQLANQEYAESLATTFEKIPYITKITLPTEQISDSYGLNDEDGLIVATAILADDQIRTLLVGNAVSTDNQTRGFYTVIDGRDEVYIVPPEPIMYLVQYLEAFENTQKLDN